MARNRLYNRRRNRKGNIGRYLKMKKLNIVKLIDDLGRVCIPKAVRKQLNWQDYDALEFYLDENNNLVLKKYNPEE